MWKRMMDWFSNTPTLAILATLPPDQRECPECQKVVHIWRTYGHGKIACVDCYDLMEPTYAPQYD